MAKGIQSATVRYILKSDEGLPTEEQTIFHIRQLAKTDRVAITQMYSRAVSQDFRGKTDINTESMKKAQREELVACIEKVENYMFGYRFPEEQEKGFFTFEDRDTIIKLVSDLHSDKVDELIDASNGTCAGRVLETESE
jgi:hypothetical protein